MTGYERGKRVLDVAVAGIGLAIILPLLILIAGLVAGTSPGGVLYRGTRTGRHGRQFRILKFRTMHANAERLGTTTTLKDPRVTPIGRILRATKLDELPQLVNVLRGEMSLVGPRPEVPEHTDVYTDAEREILDVPPGITDYASLHFADLARHLGTTDPHGEYVRRVRGEKNALRLAYVRDRSFGTDARILIRTLWLVARRLGGART